MSKPGNLWRKLHGRITKRPTNFSWIIDKKLAGCGMPTTSEEFKWILTQGVKSIVTMTENTLPNSWIKDLEYLHVPTSDLGAPSIDDIHKTVDFINGNLKNKEPVMVHCAAGIGRTGTILACYLIKYENYSPREAIKKIRSERPGSIQSELQKNTIINFGKYLE